MIVPSEVSQKKFSYYISYMCSLKKRHELIYKAEIDSQTDNKAMVTKGKGDEDKLGVWN